MSFPSILGDTLNKSLPFQKEIFEHKTKFPTHTKFSITGGNKKEKLKGAFCKTCNKYITNIIVKGR